MQFILTFVINLQRNGILIAFQTSWLSFKFFRLANKHLK